MLMLNGRICLDWLMLFGNGWVLANCEYWNFNDYFSLSLKLGS
jgi:hypothetical protein